MSSKPDHPTSPHISKGPSTYAHQDPNFPTAHQDPTTTIPDAAEPAGPPAPRPNERTTVSSCKQCGRRHKGTCWGSGPRSRKHRASGNSVEGTRSTVAGSPAGAGRTKAGQTKGPEGRSKCGFCRRKHLVGECRMPFCTRCRAYHWPTQVCGPVPGLNPGERVWAPASAFVWGSRGPGGVGRGGRRGGDGRGDS